MPVVSGNQRAEVGQLKIRGERSQVPYLFLQGAKRWSQGQGLLVLLLPAFPLTTTPLFLPLSLPLPLRGRGFWLTLGNLGRGTQSGPEALCGGLITQVTWDYVGTWPIDPVLKPKLTQTYDPGSRSLMPRICHSGRSDRSHSVPWLGLRIHPFLRPGASSDSACDLRTSLSLTPVAVGSRWSQPGRYCSQAWKAA